MDLIILIVLMAVVIFLFKRFDSFIYYIASMDILLRILAFVKNNLPVPELKALIGAYFPESIPAIIGKYTNGIFYTIFIWLYIIVFMIFWFYITRTLLRKK